MQADVVARDSSERDTLRTGVATGLGPRITNPALFGSRCSLLSFALCL